MDWVWERKGRIVLVGLIIALVLLMLFIGLGLVESQAYGQISADGGLVPDDMCYGKDGAPIIFGSAIDAINASEVYTFSYLNTHGDVVAIRYAHDFLSEAYHAEKTVVLHGAKCPAEVNQ